jgi:flavin-dependent dehydrogenase
MFLLSTGDGEGTLIATGAAPRVLLAHSRLIAERISELGSFSPEIPAYPRISQVLAVKNDLACGTAAMSFDPLCGEGAGNAIREAFLAAAVVLAGDRISLERLQAHYASRLSQGMLRHLEICHQFYSTGGEGTFWKTQSRTLQESIATMRQDMQHFPPSNLRLLDRDLVEI